MKAQDYIEIMSADKLMNQTKVSELVKLSLFGGLTHFKETGRYHSFVADYKNLVQELNGVVELTKVSTDVLPSVIADAVAGDIDRDALLEAIAVHITAQRQLETVRAAVAKARRLGG